MSETIRILGIDPGLRITGWGIIDVTGSRLTAIAHGEIKPTVSDPVPQRLRFIHEAIETLLGEYSPVEAAVEDQFVHANPGSALKLGQARAAAIIAPACAGLPIGEYAPRLVKKSVVGTGGADKSQISAMISILLPGTKASADAADALAIAICHAHHRRSPGRLAS